MHYSYLWLSVIWLITPEFLKDHKTLLEIYRKKENSILKTDKMKNASTYWMERDKKQTSMKKQF